METIQVFTAYSHQFGTSGKVIKYFENKYVKMANGDIVCINSVEHAKIGKISCPEHRIELWATKSFEERVEQDFIKLGMKEQWIYHCNGQVTVRKASDYTLVAKS